MKWAPVLVGSSCFDKTAEKEKNATTRALTFDLEKEYKVSNCVVMLFSSSLSFLCCFTETSLKAAYINIVSVARVICKRQRRADQKSLCHAGSLFAKSW